MFTALKRRLDWANEHRIRAQLTIWLIALPVTGLVVVMAGKLPDRLQDLGTLVLMAVLYPLGLFLPLGQMLSSFFNAEADFTMCLACGWMFYMLLNAVTLTMPGKKSFTALLMIFVVALCLNTIGCGLAFVALRHVGA